MKKFVFVVPILFLLIGCDPIYHLNYIVTNESNRTICVVNKQEYDTISTVFHLAPGASDTINRVSSIGYARPVFEERKKNRIETVSFYTDTTICDSCSFIPAGGWNYSESNRCEGKAVIIVKQSDITH